MGVTIMWIRGTVGVVLCLVGAIWIAQGTNALHGSGMSGHGQWTAIGAVFVLIGLVVLAWVWRRPQRL
jgi:Na+/melibiose symporter-like transporter